MVKAIIFAVFAALAIPAMAGEFTMMGGVSRFNQPHDGIYWNSNQQYNHDMIQPAFGLRYDTAPIWKDYSIGVQYTHFGEVKMDSMALIGTKHYGQWSVELGAAGGYWWARNGEQQWIKEAKAATVIAVDPLCGSCKKLPKEQK